MRLRCIIVAACLTLASSLPALSAPNADMVLNMFLSHYSTEEIAWQREIQKEEGNIEEIAARIFPPRKLGVSSFIGAYSYRSATWGELSVEERSLVLDDPRLKPWVEWFCSKQRVSVPARIGSPLNLTETGKLRVESGICPAPSRIPTGEEML